MYYLRSSQAIPNIRAFDPQARIIAMFRNPVDMLHALHSQLLYVGEEHVRDFEHAWRLQARRQRGLDLPPQCREPFLLQFAQLGQVGAQAGRLLSVFPASQVKLILYEDFAAPPRTVYDQVVEFLGLPTDGRGAFPASSPPPTRHPVRRLIPTGSGLHFAFRDAPQGQSTGQAPERRHASLSPCNSSGGGMGEAGPSRPRAIVEGMKAPLRKLRSEYRELTAPLRGLPSVLIIGTQKGGTTSLFNYLAQHPEVRPPLGKELHYFDFRHGKGLRWYRGRFPYAHRLRHALTLDATPYYMMHPLAAQRAAQLLPDVKLIAILRHPVERALSHYQHEVRGGRESLAFADALDQETQRLVGEEDRLRRDPRYYSWNHHHYAYTRRGLYLEQLRRWMEHFPRSQLLVIQSEWLFRDPPAASAAVYRFLGLTPHRLERYETFLPGNYQRGMPAPLRSRLAEYFEPHNRELFQWLGEEYDWT